MHFVSVDCKNKLISFFNLLKEYSLTESALIETFDTLEIYSRPMVNGASLAILVTTDIGYTIDIYNISEDLDRKVNLLINIISNDDIRDNQIIT